MLSRLLAQLTDRTTLFDPVAFVGVPLLSAVLAGLAAYVPARRAPASTPAESLRAEG